MTDLIRAWENWRSSGYSYEDIIVTLINDYLINSKWMQIILFITQDLCLSYNDYEIWAEKCPKTVEDVFYHWTWASKKPPKADIHIYFKNKITGSSFFKWISIKSSNISIQVLITNVDSFLLVCKWYGITNISDIVKQWLYKFCGYGKFKPSLMLSKQEKEKLQQWDRERWLIQELTDEERVAIKNFFTEHQLLITEIVLQKGSSSQAYWADYYLVNKVKYSLAGEIDFDIDTMQNVIKRCTESSYIETEKWSFHIWKITVQMKWSGKWEAYHWLQFNKSWI